MMRILVVDDNADMRESLRHLLVHHGFEAETAHDGEQALAMHRSRPYQAVITDIYMPRNDGLEAIQAFRRETPGIRIVAMSGGGSLARGRYLAVAIEIGANATLEKPFAFEELLKALRGQ